MQQGMVGPDARAVWKVSKGGEAKALRRLLLQKRFGPLSEDVLAACKPPASTSWNYGWIARWTPTAWPGVFSQRLTKPSGQPCRQARRHHDRRDTQRSARRVCSAGLRSAPPAANCPLAYSLHPINRTQLIAVRVAHIKPDTAAPSCLTQAGRRALDRLAAMRHRHIVKRLHLLQANGIEANRVPPLAFGPARH